MRSGVSTRVSILLLVLAAASIAPLPARAMKLQWATRLGKCEPPAVFYSPSHRAGNAPCCPTVEGMCAGGGACPASGMCPTDGRACVSDAIAPRPNVVLFISDDQGYCDYGTAGECRSVQTGTPVPPPSTPNLDVLAGHGTVFPIAHNTASWCFPSLASIVTGRYQKSFSGRGKLGEEFITIPKAMRALDGDATAPADPYTAGNAVGGYCTFLGGKFTASTGDAGFDALARGRKLGRTTCVPGAPGSPPRCGSEVSASYSPTTITNMEDLFVFLESLFLRLPGTNPASYTMQHFFAWVAPRVPHQPLTAPTPIQDYLFGSDLIPALGGVMNLGRYCNGGSCPPAVQAFTESNFGNQYQYYANIWWVDDAVREVREYLARAGAPHCIGGDGQGHYDVVNPAQCPGTWASAVSPAPDRNTVIIYMSDNGWFLPSSKHAFTENGYRTQMLVFDPRTLPAVPDWDGTKQVPPPPSVSRDLAHSTDVLPTALGYALDTTGSQSCPVSTDGTACDGKDLRPYVFPASTGGGPSVPLRHSLCGHHTQRPTAPTTQRYLLTRPGSVGRCTDLTAPSCTADADCGSAATCLGGHCVSGAEPACSSSSQCGAGAICLGGRCRGGPSCVDDATCTALFPGGHSTCVEPETRWCANAPSVRCTADADCPSCPSGPGPTPPPCRRLCEARQLKLYISVPTLELTDLFLDPDEHGLHGGISGEGTIARDLSRAGGPYGSTMSRLECCVDAWWPQGASGSTCSGGCPADFTCNQ
jgi:arylsulfatase A-like enzyme